MDGWMVGHAPVDIGDQWKGCVEMGCGEWWIDVRGIEVVEMVVIVEGMVEMVKIK